MQPCLANVLFSMIAGASVLFFDADLGYLEKRNPNRSSLRFKEVLRKHYPWRDGEAFTLKKRRDVVYQYGRNPIRGLKLLASRGSRSTPSATPVPPCCLRLAAT